VPEERDRVGLLEVVVGRRLPVAAERLLERLTGGRRAQARVAVEVVGADPRARDDRQRVVLLQEQLSGRVEAERARSLLPEQRLRAVGRLIGLPGEQILAPEPPGEAGPQGSSIRSISSPR
jgi:hypothetical protein